MKLFTANTITNVCVCMCKVCTIKLMRITSCCTDQTGQQMISEQERALIPPPEKEENTLEHHQYQHRASGSMLPGTEVGGVSSDVQVEEEEEIQTVQEGEREGTECVPQRQNIDISDTTLSNIVPIAAEESRDIGANHSQSDLPSGPNHGENGVQPTNSLLTLTEDESFMGSGSPLTVDKVAAVQHLHRLALQYDIGMNSGSEGSTIIRLSSASSERYMNSLNTAALPILYGVYVYGYRYVCRAICAMSWNSSKQHISQPTTFSG